MRICICGSRSITDRREVFTRLDRLPMGFDPRQTRIIIGGAREIDRLVKEWAENHGIPVEKVIPNWNRYDKRAGLVRNQKMVEIADLLVAFWDGVSTDTAHTIITAYELGKPVRVELVPVNCFSIWFMLDKFDAICVTTNGYVRYRKERPRAVMGRGVAYQLRVWMPDAEYRLGKHLVQNGNVPGVLGRINSTTIVSFPVKKECGIWPCEVVGHVPSRKFSPGDRIPGFWLKADPETIRKSAHELATLIKKEGWQKVLLPKPGCGAGELRWKDVARVLAESALAEVASRVWIADRTESFRLDFLVKKKQIL